MVRLGCPFCRATLQLPYVVPGAPVQCAGCGRQFAAGAVPPALTPPRAVKPVVIGNRMAAPPVQASNAAAVPLAVPAPAMRSGSGYALTAEPPVAVREPTKPKKPKKRRFKKKTVDSDEEPGVGAQVIAYALAALIMLAGMGYFGAGGLGLFGSGKLVDFNNKLVDTVNEFHTNVGMVPPPRLGPDAGNFFAALAPARQAVARALEAVRKITPPKEGQAFYDAVVRYLERSSTFFNQDLAQAETMVRQGQAAAAEAAMRQAINEIERLEQSLEDVQRRFAKEHGFEIEGDSKPSGPRFPSFRFRRH